MNRILNIQMIEEDVRQGEIIIEEVIVLVKPELKEPSECYFGIVNIILDWILKWYYE